MLVKIREIYEIYSISKKNGTIPKTLPIHKKINVVYIIKTKECFFIEIESITIFTTNKKVHKISFCNLLVKKIIFRL